MRAVDPLLDAFGRVREQVPQVVEGLSPEELAFRPGGRGNSICWLVWHLTRVQDDHVAELLDEEQVWTARGWAERFELPLERSDTGYGHDERQVAAVTVSSPDLLVGYHRDVADRTGTFLDGLDAGDLDRVVDERWDPPVTLGVRLVSIVEDDLQHLGQASYVRGLLG